jgi:adenylate cyclase
VRVYALRPEAVANLSAARVPPASPISPPAGAPRRSIVVLPFANLSSDPDQQYFADGITEDVTTDLSRIAGMIVISRNTAFTYQGRRVDTKQVGRELGVRYVLEGSIRRSGHQVRVNAQLIDAETDAHLWAERFDGDTSDLFALQDEITARIGNTLNLELMAAEAARPSKHPDVLDYILRGRAAGLRGSSPDSYAERVKMFERALTLDPQSVEAQSRLAASLVKRVLDQMSETAAADLERAGELVGRALAANPRDAVAHCAQGDVLRVQNRLDEAAREYETALAFDRNSTNALNGLAHCKFLGGSLNQAIGLWEEIVRRSPRDPGIGWRYGHIGAAHLLQSRTDEAIIWLERARRTVPAAPVFCARLAATYSLRGETERASVQLAEARRLSRDDRYSSVARLRAVGYWEVPKVRALFEATYFEGLRKAGMPEE